MTEGVDRWPVIGQIARQGTNGRAFDMLNEALSRISRSYYSVVDAQNKALARLFYPSGRPLLIWLGVVQSEDPSERRLRIANYALERLFIIVALIFSFVLFGIVFSSACGWTLEAVLSLPFSVEWKEWMHLHTIPMCRHYEAPADVMDRFYIFTAILTVPLCVFFILYIAVSNAYDSIFVVPQMPAKPFVLFLRSFFIESKIKSEPAFIPLAKLNKSLFREIAKAIGPAWAVSKIGSRTLGFDFDGGTVRSHDNDWEERFLALAEKSERIVMVPIVWQDGAGTHKEMKHISSRGWLAKTIFVVPPRGRVMMSPARGMGLLPSMEKLWGRSRDFLGAQKILNLPAYPGRSGLLFLHDSQWVFVPGVNGKYWNVRRALQKVLLSGSIVDRPAVNAARVASRLLLYAVIFLLFFSIAADNLSSIFDVVFSSARFKVLIEAVSPATFAMTLLWGTVLVGLLPLAMVHGRYCKYFAIKRPGAWMLAIVPMVSAIAAIHGLSGVIVSNEATINLWRSEYGSWISDVVFLSRFAAVWVAGFITSYVVLRWFDLGLAGRNIWQSDGAVPPHLERRVGPISSSRVAARG